VHNCAFSYIADSFSAAISELIHKAVSSNEVSSSEGHTVYPSPSYPLQSFLFFSKLSLLSCLVSLFFLAFSFLLFSFQKNLIEKIDFWLVEKVCNKIGSSVADANQDISSSSTGGYERLYNYSLALLKFH
jgi:hypothetical protein